MDFLELWNESDEVLDEELNSMRIAWDEEEMLEIEFRAQILLH